VGESVTKGACEMKMSLTREELLSYLCAQLNNFFPDGKLVKSEHLKGSFDYILKRLEYCFSRVNSKYFCHNGKTAFNHLNSDQYAMFLYFAANTVYKTTKQVDLATKLFLLNKCLHGIDVFYEVDLPDIFLFVHPLGTVLGRGKYSNYFVVYQRCSIGSNHDNYPIMGENLIMHPGSAILGNCRIGDNCRIAAGSLVMDIDLEPNSIYIGNPSKYFIKKSETLPSIWM
jgi:serine O-acetyltransferase